VRVAGRSSACRKRWASGTGPEQPDLCAARTAISVSKTPQPVPHEIDGIYLQLELEWTAWLVPIDTRGAERVAPERRISCHRARCAVAEQRRTHIFEVVMVALWSISLLVGVID
jgi:hypothetical protein